MAVMLPKIAIDMGLCEPDEVWFVDKALYGLRENSKLWGDLRDAELRQARWVVEGVEYCLQQMMSDVVAPWHFKDSDRKVATLTAETAQGSTAAVKRHRLSWFSC